MIPKISERLFLKPLQYSDIEFIHNLHSLPEINKFNLLRISKNISETEELVSKWVLNNEFTDQQNFTNSIIEADELIRSIDLNTGKLVYKNIEVWFKIHSKYWIKGYATEALKTVLDFRFNNLNLPKIEAGCAVGNTLSIKVLEKSRMILEGRKRQLLSIKSGWSNNFLYPALATDFKS